MIDGEGDFWYDDDISKAIREFEFRGILAAASQPMLSSSQPTAAMMNSPAANSAVASIMSEVEATPTPTPAPVPRLTD